MAGAYAAPARASLVDSREAVPDTTHRLDERRFFRCRLDLVAKPAHIHLEVLRLVAVLRPPDAREEGIVGERLAGMARELGEQIELGRSEVDVLAGAPDASRRQVDREIVRVDRSRPRWARRRAAQHALDPRDELARGERLREVIVRTETESFDLVLFETARGQDDDRQICLLAHLLEDREPVPLGKGEIEHHKVGPLGVDHRERLIAIGGLDRGQVLTRVGERAPHERAYVGLVVDDEYLQDTSGSTVTNAEPPPGFSSYSRVPPWSVTSDRAIASPRPEPGVPSAFWPRKNLSKIRCRSSVAIPGPWSRTSMRSASPRRWATTRIGVPCGA